MAVRVTPCSAALVSSQGAPSCLRGAGCVNCHESFHRLSNNREDLVVMVDMERPLSCPMLPQVAIVICYGVPSYREAAWRVWLVGHAATSLPLNIPSRASRACASHTGTLERCEARHFRQHYLLARWSSGPSSLCSPRLLPFALFRTMGPLLLDCRLLMALCHISLAVKWPRGKCEERLACASPVKRSRHQVRVPVCGGVSHACHVLSRRIIEFCEKCCLLICASLTRRRITEGKCEPAFNRTQSHGAGPDGAL